MNKKYFIWCKSTSMGILKLMLLRNRQTRRNHVRRQWIDVTFYACACKGYKPASKIKTFHSNVKQKVLNDETHLKRQRMVPVYAMFLRTIMTLKCLFPFLDLSAN